MLDQLDVHRGHHVLKIGAGTGFNGAVIGELVGPGGVTFDVDPDVAMLAPGNLGAAGHHRVEVRTGDGRSVRRLGTRRPIIGTTGVWDPPPGWTAQLAAGGRLVVPLR